jgi:hypothetical protein
MKSATILELMFGIPARGYDLHLGQGVAKKRRTFDPLHRTITSSEVFGCCHREMQRRQI